MLCLPECKQPMDTSPPLKNKLAFVTFVPPKVDKVGTCTYINPFSKETCDENRGMFDPSVKTSRNISPLIQNPNFGQVVVEPPTCNICSSNSITCASFRV